MIQTGQVPSPWDGSPPYPFENWSGETIPAYAVMAVVDTVYTEGIPFFKVEKPSTTFRPRYVFNGPRPIRSTMGSQKGRGSCYERGMLRCKYESGATPVNGKAYGPKPGSWELWEGFPSCIHVEGVLDADKKWLIGLLSPITSLLCKATADLSAGPVSSNFQIWKGTMASGANAGFTTLPEIELSEDIPEDAFFVAHWTGGGWTVTTGGTAVARRFLATLDAALATSDSTKGVTLTDALDGMPLPDDVTVTGKNPLGWAGPSGAKCIIGENRSEDPKEYIIEVVQHYDCED